MKSANEVAGAQYPPGLGRETAIGGGVHCLRKIWESGKLVIDACEPAKRMGKTLATKAKATVMLDKGCKCPVDRGSAHQQGLIPWTMSNDLLCRQMPKLANLMPANATIHAKAHSAANVVRVVFAGITISPRGAAHT